MPVCLLFAVANSVIGAGVVAGADDSVVAPVADVALVIVLSSRLVLLLML